MEFFLKAVDSIYWETKIPKGSHASAERTLKEEGYNPVGRCPKELAEPDIRLLTNRGFERFANLVASLDDSQMRVLTALMISNDKLNRVGFKAGQRVYINLSTPVTEYVDNYFTGYIVKFALISEDNIPYVYVAGSLNEVLPTLMMLPVSSIKTEEQFEKHKLKLIRKGLEKNPKRIIKGFTITKPNHSLIEIKDFLDNTKRSRIVKTKKKHKKDSAVQVRYHK